MAGIATQSATLATVPSATVIAADNVGAASPPAAGERIQYMKVDLGAAGASAPAVGSMPTSGDVASGSADTGNPVKAGALAKTGLPTAVSDGQRVARLADIYGRARIIVERPKLLGAYKFESGRLTVLAAAHAATAGFFWLINPVSSGVAAKVKKLMATSVPTAVTAFPSAPRITVERVTFTGTPSGAQIAVAKRDSTDAANVCSVRSASTGLTLAAGAICSDFTVPPVLTAVGIAVPVDQYMYDSTDEDDYIVLRAGEGLVFRQADAGTTSDTRLITIYGSWEES